MVDFINEVEEELRKDDYNKFLKKFGPFILGLIIAIILIAAYFEFSKARADKTSRAVSAAYVEAGEMAAEGDVDNAIRQFVGVAEKSPSGYAGLSYMRAAALQIDQNNPAEAIRLFELAADSFDLPRHADLARLKASYIMVGQGRYDDAKLRLVPLAEKDSPYEYLARELLALAYKETGDISRAKQEYSYLENIPGVSPTVQARAKQVMTLIRVQEDAALSEDVNTTALDNSGAEPSITPSSSELDVENEDE